MPKATATTANKQTKQAKQPFLMPMLDGSFDCYYLQQKGHNKKWLVKNIFGKSKAQEFIHTQTCRLLLNRLIGYLHQQQFIGASMSHSPIFKELLKAANGIYHQNTISILQFADWLHHTGIDSLTSCAVHTTSRYRVGYVELLNDCKAFIASNKPNNATI